MTQTDHCHIKHNLYTYRLENKWDIKTSQKTYFAIKSISFIFSFLGKRYFNSIKVLQTFSFILILYKTEYN